MESLQIILAFALVGLISLISAANPNPPPPCDSKIYCHGPLLHTVQLAHLFKDSKTFVDMKLKHPPSQILLNFDLFMSQHRQSPPKEELRAFIRDNFDPEGSEFTPWDPSDWFPSPAFLGNITDPKLRTWASQLHSYWKELGRKIKEDVKQRPELYSMIYTSNPVIVPGGRFREFFYWDSYWIMKGLLLSEMHHTVKGMLENFIEMVNQLGYVPNGGRVYFRRSQPPLLIPMVKLYMENRNDVEFLRKNLPALETEFNFWMMNRTMSVQKGGKSYRVVRYNVEYTGPRPESYREDYELAEKLSSKKEKDELYFNLKSGAESGWDYSSRWFIPPNGVKGSLEHTKVRDIIPVELNTFIYLNAKLLAEFHRMVGSSASAAKYDNLANEWRTTINEVMWDETEGCWFDYDLINKVLRKEFYVSNLTPLWAGVQSTPQTVVRVLDYLKKTGAVQYPGGVPTSLTHAGEQWDFPNGWAPLQHLVVDALDNSGNEEAKALAFELSERWISSNYKAFTQSKHMFEKYDVTVVGLPGGGGEYDVVVGFGWTNGVVLDFLNRFGDRMKVPAEGKSNDAAPTNKIPSFMSNSVLLGSISVLIASLLGLSQVGRCKESCDKRNGSTGTNTSRTSSMRNNSVEYSKLPAIDEVGADVDADVFPSSTSNHTHTHTHLPS